MEFNGATQELRSSLLKAPNHFETSGISTTPHLHRAQHYATTHNNNIIVTINTAMFDDLGICAHRVADCVDSSLISIPEDDEIILVYPDGHEFPPGLIVSVTVL